MKIVRVPVLVSLFVLFLGLVTGRAETETMTAPDGCPVMNHAPVVRVMRGEPAVIHATITCAPGTVEEVKVLVRLTDEVAPVWWTRGGNSFHSYANFASKSTGLM